jgi:beta-galactosidase
MTLYVKRNGKPTEYVPLYVGAGETTFADGAILRNGKPITIKSAAYNAAATMAATRKEIVALRSKGINTLMPDSPQPVWFYELCDKIGMYIIEQASINPTEGGDNRAVGGTPSNNPQLVEHYLERVKSMYYRTRNHASIIAYSLGSKSAGNGYCMYKAYQWLKSVEKQRPVICYSADGEWNTDM